MTMSPTEPDTDLDALRAKLRESYPEAHCIADWDDRHAAPFGRSDVFRSPEHCAVIGTGPNPAEAYAEALARIDAAMAPTPPEI
jgi:hypothetical protein